MGAGGCGAGTFNFVTRLRMLVPRVTITFAIKQVLAIVVDEANALIVVTVYTFYF
jgi:hypothetical protein